MTQEHSDLLKEIAGETLEQLAFIFSYPDEMDPDGIWEEATTGCRVAFKGPKRGELLLNISTAALPELASNMLGLDEEDAPPEDQQLDALREALNVICGNLLPRIGGVDAIFDIQAPEIINADAARGLVKDFLDAPQGCATAFLSLDDGECQLYLRTENSG